MSICVNCVRPSAANPGTRGPGGGRGPAGGPGGGGRLIIPGAAGGGGSVDAPNEE